MREIMQEIALAGLARSGFFEKAAFYGGTALRIFYGIERFSEDLDFSLLEVNPDFELQPYLDGMEKEFNAFGIDVTIKEKAKSKELILNGIIPQEKIGMRPEIKIKLEVDTHPPLKFLYRRKTAIETIFFLHKMLHTPRFVRWQNACSTIQKMEGLY